MDNMDKIETMGSKDYSYNMYSYCMNNPIMMSDLSGAELVLSLSLVASTVLIIVGVIFAFVTVYYIAKYIGELIRNSGNIGVCAGAG